MSTLYDLAILLKPTSVSTSYQHPSGQKFTVQIEPNPTEDPNPVRVRPAGRISIFFSRHQRGIAHYIHIETDREGTIWIDYDVDIPALFEQKRRRLFSFRDPKGCETDEEFGHLSEWRGELTWLKQLLASPGITKLGQNFLIVPWNSTSPPPADAPNDN